ncbi:hypothetical protein M8494_37690 [Serratia ureilytica]
MKKGTIRHLTLRYLTEVKHGQYQGVPPQRWKLVGMEGYEPQRAIVKRLLNEGVIRYQPPTTAHQRRVDQCQKRAVPQRRRLPRRPHLAGATAPSRRGSVQQRRLQDRIALIKALNDFLIVAHKGHPMGGQTCRDSVISY